MSFFVLSSVISVVRCGLKFKSLRESLDPDFISLKVTKFAWNVINSHVFNVITKDLEKIKYSKEPITVLVRPIFKKNRRNKIEGYRTVHILNVISKMYERCMYNNGFSCT